MTKTILLSTLAALIGCSSDGSGTNTVCGTGTMLQDGMCIPTTGGDNTTCGTGTHLMGTMCVPDATGVAAAPTVASIDPPHAGVSGNVLFTITGTGFAGSNVTSLDVWFGDTTNMYCKATVGAATATTIAGEVPGACDLNVDVTVQTNVGMATIPFHYDALFAADGDAGGQIGASGDIYIVDPFAQVSFDLGPLTDDAGTTYGISGMDFDAAGTLWAVTTGDSAGDNGVSQLVTIDALATTVTVIGNTVDATAHPYFITDIKMVGTTLYGWGYHGTKRGLVTINTTTGAVTAVGAGQTDTYPYVSGSLVVDGTGALLVSTNGAAADTAVGSTGVFSSVNMGTGGMTSMVTLDYNYGAPIEAMTTYGSGTSAVLLGAVDDGQYGVANDTGLGPTNFGVTLTMIDPNADTSMSYITNPLFELPAQVGQQSHIDALAIPPASVGLTRQMPHVTWQKLDVAPSHVGHPARHAHL